MFPGRMNQITQNSTFPEIHRSLVYTDTWIREVSWTYTAETLMGVSCEDLSWPACCVLRWREGVGFTKQPQNCLNILELKLLILTEPLESISMYVW